MLNRVFRRAAKEPEFRTKLLNEPEVILQEFQISEKTMQIIVEAIRSMVS